MKSVQIPSFSRPYLDTFLALQVASFFYIALDKNEPFQVPKFLIYCLASSDAFS